MDETYNGWRNRETWLINLWFGDNWENEADVYHTREYIEEELIKLPGWVKDMVYDCAIDWEELAESAEA